MKLITEHTENVNVISEESDDGGKNYYIEGVFLQADILNKNKRNYRRDILESAVNRFVKTKMNRQSAVGELGHPPTPTVNLDRASHKIVDLKVDGNNWIGKAKIMESLPMGGIVKGLLDEGVQLGVSSRGMGTLSARDDGIDEVQEDYVLQTIDIVSDPSAPDAYVRGILEGREWVWDNGILVEKVVDDHKKIIQSVSNKELERKALKLFEEFLNQF